MLAGYRIAGQALRPAVPAWLAARVRRGKEDPDRLGERYGRASVAVPAGPVVWVHAASVGETTTALPLIDRVVGAGAAVVLTTVTCTSARIAAERLPAGAVHQYVPLDIAPYVRRFHDHWHPELMVLVEKELWPVMLAEAAKRGVRVAVVNGRLSDHTYAAWRKHRATAAGLMANLGLVLAQSPEDAERFADLGARDVMATGNMKFDVPAPSVDPGTLGEVRAMAGGRRIWLAASTHEGEELAAAHAHRQLVTAGLKPLTVVVPRHPERGEAIAAALRAEGMAASRRSRGEPVDAATDIYVADTLGELGTFYAAAEVAFVGGSLADIGGHNPIEPAKLGVPIVHGPHIENLADIYRVFAAHAAAIAVADADALGFAVGRLFTSPTEAQRLADAARALVEAGTGALDRTYRALAAFAGWHAAGPHASGP